MKIGIYGGTFSPPHLGHVRAASLFLENVPVEKFIIMPAGIPPHKEVSVKVDGMLRLEMCRASFSGLSDRIAFSDFEINKKGKSYTFETVSQFPKSDEICVLCGEDMILSLETWYRAAELMKLCTFAAVARTQGANERLTSKAAFLKEKYGAEVKVIKGEPFEASSSEIREMISKGEDVSPLVAPAVYEIICREGLYR